MDDRILKPPLVMIFPTFPNRSRNFFSRFEQVIMFSIFFLADANWHVH